MPVLKNAKHECFAQEIARGAKALKAYEVAGYKPDTASASRLSGRPEVRARVAELQEVSAQGTTLDLHRTLVYLERVILTPIVQVDERSDLCQEFTMTERAGTTTVRCKMPGKLDAIEKLIKLRGWYAPEKVAMDAGDKLGDLLARIRNRSREAG